MFCWKFESRFFSMPFVNIHVVHPFSSWDTSTVWKKFRFISSDRSDFHMIDTVSIVVHAFVRSELTSCSGDETLLPRYMSLSTNFRGSPFRVEMTPSRLKHIYFVLFAVTLRLMLPANYSKLSSRDSAWAGVFERSARSSV